MGVVATRILGFTFAAILLANSAFAQGGAVCLFTDPTGTDCNIVDNTPGLLTIYVVHKLTPGASAVQFAAPKPACMVSATWLTDTPVFPATIGDSQNGVSIGYGGCFVGPVHVLTMNYQVAGLTTPDCAYPVVAHPSEPLIEVVDCDATLLPGTGGVSYINSSLACWASSRLRAFFQ